MSLAERYLKRGLGRAHHPGSWQGEVWHRAEVSLPPEWFRPSLQSGFGGGGGALLR